MRCREEEKKKEDRRESLSLPYVDVVRDVSTVEMLRYQPGGCVQEEEAGGRGTEDCCCLAGTAEYGDR